MNDQYLAALVRAVEDGAESLNVNGYLSTVTGTLRSHCRLTR